MRHTTEIRSIAVIATLAFLALAGTRADAFAPMAASGASHTLFLTEAGTITGVGDNAHGQLGDGTTTSSVSGVAPTGIAGVVMIAAGSQHSLALKGDGTVWAWGANDAGQLGLGNASEQHTPVQVPGLAGIVAIAAGSEHSLALASDGTVYAWGSNAHLQTGGPCGSASSDVLSPLIVNTSSSPSPCTPTGPLTGVVSIAAGDAFNVALLSDGSVVTWGDDTYGQLGNGTTGSDSAVPVSVSGISLPATRIAAGGSHAIALTSDTRAVAWGHNDHGQLGDNSTTDRPTPVSVSIATDVPPFSIAAKGIALIGAGSAHSLIVYQTGPIAAFGAGASGQLGSGGASDETTASNVGTYNDCAGVFAGPTADRSFVYIPGLGQYGHFESFGSDANGELGLGSSGSNVLVPASVAVVTQVGDKIGRRTNFGVGASNSDLLWRNTGNGVNVTWGYTGSGATQFTASGLPTLPGNWTGLGTGDFDGDGVSDALWLDTSTGQVAIWLMKDASNIASVVFPGTIASPWQFAGIGDFNGDGRDDVLWRNATTGEVEVWHFGIGAQTVSVASIGTVGLEWQIKGVGDFNGDWISDILWFRVSDGQVAIWQMSRTGSFVAWFPAAVGAGSPWEIRRIGDFDGDGRDDIFWRNTADGTNAVWYMTGGNQIANAQFFVGTPLADWSDDATGDFDGDGRDDLMWTGISTGTTLRWLMQGRGSTPVYQTVTGIGSGWQAVQ